MSGSGSAGSAGKHEVDHQRRRVDQHPAGKIGREEGDSRAEQLSRLADVGQRIAHVSLARRHVLGRDDDRPAWLEFAGKFQQLTAPTTAKGIEDTAFYIYNRFVSLNEVGGEPQHFGTTPDAMHAYLADRQRLWPYALSAMSTHDTKRSEDVRTRLAVLSEIPDDWFCPVCGARKKDFEPYEGYRLSFGIEFKHPVFKTSSQASVIFDGSSSATWSACVMTNAPARPRPRSGSRNMPMADVEVRAIPLDPLARGRRVAVGGVPLHLTVDARAARLGVLVFLDHQHPGALAQHETVAVLVPGTTGALRVIVARRQCARLAETGHARGCGAGLAAAGDIDVGIARLDQARAQANAVRCRRAGGDDREVRPGDAQVDGDVAGDHVDDRSRHEEWRDLARPAGLLLLLRGSFRTGHDGTTTIRADVAEGLRFLTLEGTRALFDFPRDMARVPAQVNRLSNQVLVTTYEREWGQIHP